MIYRKNRFSPQNKTSASLKLLTTASALALVGCGGGTGGGSFFVPGSECIELGDIVISVPTAIKQAKDNNVDLLRELRWLASHGLLHLLGWDHCDQESLTQMLITQEQLLDLRGNV